MHSHLFQNIHLPNKKQKIYFLIQILPIFSQRQKASASYLSANQTTERKRIKNEEKNNF
jgi:hypothetical protein